MVLLKLLILGILLGVGGYYLRIYLKGSMCHLSNRIDRKNVLITGANTGIGLETAIELASRGGIIHMACRDDKKCESARKEVLRRTEVDHSFVVTYNLDLASIRSILRFSESFKLKVTKLDILINNAGIMMCPYGETEDGFEMQIGVNHLGHFLLTKELVDLLKLGHSSRIIIVSSRIHNYGNIDLEDINLRGDNYGKILCYANSKLANVLHTKSLSKRLQKSGIAVVSLHPGVVDTELKRNLPIWFLFVSRMTSFMFMKTPVEGSQTSVCCAVDPNLMLHTGEYFSDCQKTSSRNNQVYNESLSEWLWEHSENLIKAKLIEI